MKTEKSKYFQNNFILLFTPKANPKFISNNFYTNYQNYQNKLPPECGDCPKRLSPVCCKIHSL